MGDCICTIPARARSDWVRRLVSERFRADQLRVQGERGAHRHAVAHRYYAASDAWAILVTGNSE